MLEYFLGISVTSPDIVVKYLQQLPDSPTMAGPSVSAQLAYPTPISTPPVTELITVLASSRAVLGSSPNAITPATLTISLETGKILSITPSVLPQSSFPVGTDYHNVSPYILMPGLVDAHVHLNEPGRTEWEGFWTGTQAAASGGVTTVIDMPLNAIPPTTTVNGLKEKVKAAQGQCWVDVGFYGGIIPGNADELLPLIEAGVRGFKGFLIESGVDEFPAVSSTDVALAMSTLNDSQTTLMFHAEMIPPITDSVGDNVQVSLPPMQPVGPLNEYATFLASRPPAFETYAIEEILALCSIAPQLRLHIVHLSAVEGISLLKDARARGVNITAETCFHYLTLAAEDVEDGDTRHKCCPPIRSLSNQAGLWEELQNEDSVIQTVVSDHSPCTPELKLLPRDLVKECKVCHDMPCLHDTVQHLSAGVNGELGLELGRGDFFSSWGGVSSVGLGLPILWTAGTAADKAKPISILDVVRWCCVNTAKQVGLSHQKGALEVGMDGDVCVFDDEGKFVVGRAQMLFRNKVSPYQGKTMRGVVRETYLRGRRVFTRHDGFETKKGPVGQLLLEKRTA